MRINDFTSLGEKISYVNGYLSAIETLNTTSNNIMDHDFILVKLIANDIEKSLQTRLNVQNTSFLLKKIVNWESIFESNGEYFFSNVISAIQDSEDTDPSCFPKLYHQLNLKDQLSDFINCMNKILSLFEFVEIFEVVIDCHDQKDSANLFAHAEINYVFKINKEEFLFLRLTAYD